MFTATILVVSLIVTAFADPKPPSFTYLYSINLTMPAGINIGNTPAGGRAILPISGGTFWGPKFNGTVGIGFDWGLTDTKGTFSPDAIYTLHTSDGANIMVTEKGHAPNVQILFETGDERYSWLNPIVGYATGAPFDGGVALDVWQLGG
ncbi:hypothetical protein CONLIGDRAFT_663322 [Coniochaeta ligniaria NRRL 30616]|uniref:Uncharacterized protein n=1 Tax=Coniochaeta ligniaria NRRL 30616 TaxID=1408157 RepID=A0A1J7IDQ9_9PEZI|nr:hypothetical protein CONLIGDRAFT_663322 [Coniochaeta ligniaria NRRL 30616]